MSSSRAGGVDSTRLFCVVFAPVVVVVVVVVDVGGRVSATSGGDLTGVCLALFGRGQCRGWFGLLRQEYPSCDCLKVFYILGQQAANVLANIGCLQSCGHRLTTRSTSGINFRNQLGRQKQPKAWLRLQTTKGPTFSQSRW